MLISAGSSDTSSVPGETILPSLVPTTTDQRPSILKGMNNVEGQWAYKIPFAIQWVW